ncbi:MAG: N-acetylmuramoyl-L-alanine amidase [Patescibacteria group bacterium]|nr:N-acetylmuramoyl-L-alanine amidase [Patescibacteria group bacterium]
MNVFAPNKWKEKITDPHWYFEVPALMKAMKELHDKDRAAYELEKERIYDFFEAELGKETIALGTTGKDFDAERKPIDTIVVHHTSLQPGLTKERLSAIDLVRLYAVEFAAPKYREDAAIKNRPIWSNHLRDGRQVFWPYHWIVRVDGNAERLLEDYEIGWQAGNWDVNCRSVAIVFDDEFEDKDPADIQLEGAAKIIREHYPLIKKENIIGHCEVRGHTDCPSPNFLSKNGKIGWKSKLLTLV